MTSTVSEHACPWPSQSPASCNRGGLGTGKRMYEATFIHQLLFSQAEQACLTQQGKRAQLQTRCNYTCDSTILMLNAVAGSAYCLSVHAACGDHCNKACTFGNVHGLYLERVFCVEDDPCCSSFQSLQHDTPFSCRFDHAKQACWLVL